MSDLIPGFNFTTFRLIWSKPSGGKPYKVTLDDGSFMFVFPDGHWERQDVTPTGMVALNRGNDGLNPAEFSPYGLLAHGQASAEEFYADLRAGRVLNKVETVRLPEPEAV